MRIKYLLPILVAALLLSSCGSESKTDSKSGATKNLTQKNKIVDIVLVLADSNDEKIHGQWPWKRSRHATIINFLNKSGARVIALDMFFADKTTPAEDDILISAIKSVNVPIYTSALLSKNLGGLEDLTDKEIKAYALNMKVQGHLSENEEDHIILPFKPVRDAGVQIGFTNVYPDGDKILRNVPLLILYKEYGFQSLPMAVFLEITNLKSKQVLLDPRNSIEVGGTKFTLRGASSLRLKWTPPRTFATHSYDEILSGRAKAEDFKDKVVFVGYNGSTYPNKYATSSSKEFPGTEIHAVALNNILNHYDYERSK